MQLKAGCIASAHITTLITKCRTWKMWSEIMCVSLEHLWVMWWVSRARLSPIRESGEWQQTEELSKVAMHDPALEHQPQPNSSLIFWQGHVESSHFSLCLSLLFSLPSPLPCPWQRKYATFVDSVMRRWVLLSHSFFHFILNSSLLLPFGTSVSVFICLSKDCLSHVTTLTAAAILAKQVLSQQCILWNWTSLFETCLHCVLVNHASC